MATRAMQEALGQKETDHGKSAIGKKKTESGTAFFSKGGSMAAKKPNPFAKFEKSGKDKEPKGMKEGSKKEEAFDRKQMKGKAFAMKKGGKC